MSFIQIASWNIEHLGNRNPRQSAFALADHIEMSGIHVIALQEIYVTPAAEDPRLGPNQPPIPSHAVGERRNSYLDVVCYLLEEHLDVPWKYQIAPNRSPGDTSQLCATMWNTAQLTLDSVTALNVLHKHEDDSLWDRKPHIFSFVSDIDVWRKPDGGEWVKVPEKRRLNLVPLHMKSNYDGVTKNRRIRGKEAATLCDAIEGLGETLDRTLVLIGDTNILRNDEPAIETFVTRGFVDLNNTDASTYWSAEYADAPFDRAFVLEGRPEFRYTRQYVLRSSDLKAHDKLLSDHYMIKISVKDYVDDADPR